MEPLTMLALVSPLLVLCLAILVHAWKDGKDQ